MMFGVLKFSERFCIDFFSNNAILTRIVSQFLVFVILESFFIRFVSYNKKEDPEMPKGEDTIIEEEPINKDLEQARPPVVRKSPGETQTVPGRGSAAIEGYGVRDGQAVDDEF